MEAKKCDIEISVIMGVYNQKDRRALEQAVDSILDQTFTAFEFLIYDDGSCMEEAETIRKLAAKDGRIRLLRGEKNQGLANALNACLKAAKGRYLARMDADDISAPERLQTQKKYLDKHPEYAFVGLNAELFDEAGTWGFRQMTEHPGPAEFLKYSPYIHPTVMFRREVLEAAGGYLVTKDTRRCEDYELFMRLYNMGFHGSNMQVNLFSYRENRRNYDKRTMLMRIAEMKIRYHGFRSMGILNGKNMIYVVKPVLLFFLPNGIKKIIRMKCIQAAEEWKDWGQ